MKERPILFQGAMVRALLAGTKTQTRRVVKPQHLAFFNQDAAVMLSNWNDRPLPYGQPGDRLWVRESWMPDPPIDDTWASTQWAGCREGRIAGVPERFRHPRFCNYAADWLHGEVLWTPSIHMPRWASRITLEITGVRVERLQEIGEADALAEGIVPTGGGFGLPDGSHFHSTDPRVSYWSLWESINGTGSVEANPWVWVVEFKRAEA